MMRTSVLSLLTAALLIGLAGCDAPSAPQRMPVTPPGVAPLGQDLSDLSKPASQPAPPPAAAPAAPAAAPVAAAPPAAAPAPAAPPADNGGIFGKVTGKVVDVKAYKQNPNFRVVDTTPSGSDPLTYALGAYISIRSRASTLGFQGAVNQFKAVEGRNPTYDEFMKMVKENRMEFTEVEPFRMYGYDQDTGGIVILEDIAEKTRIYKAAGLDPNGT